MIKESTTFEDALLYGLGLCWMMFCWKTYILMNALSCEMIMIWWLFNQTETFELFGWINLFIVLFMTLTMRK